MTNRFKDTNHLNALLTHLEDRVDSKFKLADCDSTMNWPNRGGFFL